MNPLKPPRTPLTPAVLHLPLAPRDGEEHGYATMEEAEHNTSRQVLTEPRTLHGTTKRHLRTGLIKESDERPDAQPHNQRRRCDPLTHPGHRALSEEIQRLDQPVTLACL